MPIINVYSKLQQWQISSSTQKWLFSSMIGKLFPCPQFENFMDTWALATCPSHAALNAFSTRRRQKVLVLLPGERNWWSKPNYWLPGEEGSSICQDVMATILLISPFHQSGSEAVLWVFSFASSCLDIRYWSISRRWILWRIRMDCFFKKILIGALVKAIINNSGLVELPLAQHKGQHVRALLSEGPNCELGGSGSCVVLDNLPSTLLISVTE